jgi:hypothetical protein
MRYFVVVLMAVVAAGETAVAHGPQIQITATGGKIVTRELIVDGPYSTSLTPPKTVYVMPMLDNLGVSYARPNYVDFVVPGVPEFYSGPGLAYGYGYDAATNPAPFAGGTTFGFAFVDGFKKWDGTAFSDPGVAQMQAFTGGFSAPTGTATTTESPVFQSLQIPAAPASIDFSADHEEVHSTARFRYLGDGVTPSSAPDGIYLLSFVLVNPPIGALPSDPFYFVLSKNGAPAALEAAVGSLGVSPSLVQSLVPEPGMGVLVCGLFVPAAVARGRRRRGEFRE